MPYRLVDDRRTVDTTAPQAPYAGLEDLRTFITITRTHRQDVKQRQVVVTIDGERRTTLLYGDSVTLEVAAGEHRLRVHNTLVWRTVRFAVEPGEHLEFMVINRSPAWTYAMLALFGAAPMFLRIERRSLS